MLGADARSNSDYSSQWLALYCGIYVGTFFLPPTLTFDVHLTNMLFLTNPQPTWDSKRIFVMPS